MPSSIPYDHPSLVLGNLIDTQILKLLKQINSSQAKIDAAYEKLNSFMMMKRSLAMTINELVDMNVDVSSIKDKLKELDTSITQSATDYMSIRISCESDIQNLREKISETELADGMESIIDFSQSIIKKLPLSSESLKLDIQYFSFGSNQEDDTISSIEKYVRESTSNLGSQSTEMAKTVASQLKQQKQNHNLVGTLIITASCTHRNIAILEPLVIDIDKAINTWNHIYSTNDDKISTSDPVALKTLSEKDGDIEKSLSILSGVVYGSSFIGMVHIIKNDSSSIGPSNDLKAELEEKLKIGGWIQNANGDFGVEPSLMNDVKKLLSSQSISSHVSLVVMGAVPSIASNQIKLGVNKLLQPSTEKLNTYMQALTEYTVSGGDALETGSNNAKNSGALLNIQSKTNQSVIKELGEIDHGTNKVIDINSLMSAFENYLSAIKDTNGSIGVPIDFYLKKITKNQIIKWWLDKYYPEK